MISLRRAMAAAAVSAVLACGDSSGPVPGTLTVNLTTPNSGLDGAVMLVLTAPTAPNGVTATTGLALWGGPVTTTSAKLVVTGTIDAGPILTLQVNDVNQVAQYSVTVQQVAQSAAPHPLRNPLTGYSATVTK